MDVVHDLGVPNIVGTQYSQLGLYLGEGVPIPVVVMASVLVVKPGQGCCFVLGPDPLVIPVHDPLQAVWVQRGDVQEDHIVQDLSDFFFA